MSDHVEGAAAHVAEVLWDSTTPDGMRAATRPDCYAIARALDAAGLLVTPEHDAAVAAKVLAGVAERLAESGRLWHGSDGVSVMWNQPYMRTTPLFDWLRAGAPPFDDSGEAGLADMQRCVAKEDDPV